MNKVCTLSVKSVTAGEALKIRRRVHTSGGFVTISGWRKGTAPASHIRMSRSTHFLQVMVLLSLSYDEGPGDNEGEGFRNGNCPPDTVQPYDKGQEQYGKGLEH